MTTYLTINSQSPDDPLRTVHVSPQARPKSKFLKNREMTVASPSSLNSDLSGILACVGKLVYNLGTKKTLKAFKQAQDEQEPLRQQVLHQLHVTATEERGRSPTGHLTNATERQSPTTQMDVIETQVESVADGNILYEDEGGKHGMAESGDMTETINSEL